MTDTRTARITLSPNPSNCSAEVNGHDISNAVHALRVEYEASGRLPLLWLDLVVYETTVDGEVSVALKPATHDALIALGWTPPTDSTAESFPGVLVAMTAEQLNASGWLPPFDDPEALRELASHLLTAANEAEGHAHA